MKTNLSALLSLLFCFTLTNCEKEDSNITILRGQITEYGSDKPIEGARVVILGGLSGSGGTGILEGTEFDTILSDATGAYRAAGEVPLDFIFTRVEKVGYFNGTNTDGIIVGKDNYIDYILDPHAWLKVKIKNVSRASYLSINGYAAQGGFPFYGNNVDTTILLLFPGNRTKELRWFTRKDGIDYSFSEEIYLSSHDTVELEILY